MHQIQGRAATFSSSSSQSTVTTDDEGAKEIGLIESAQEDKEIGWLFVIADAVAINQLALHGRCSQLGCRLRGLRACVSQKLCHSRAFAITAGMPARIGSSISEWQDAQGLVYARDGFQWNGSAGEDFHSEDPLCCL